MKRSSFGGSWAAFLHLFMTLIASQAAPPTMIKPMIWWLQSSSLIQTPKLTLDRPCDLLLRWLSGHMIGLTFPYLYRFYLAAPPPLFLMACGLCHMLFILQPLRIDKTPPAPLRRLECSRSITHYCGKSIGVSRLKCIYCVHTRRLTCPSSRETRLMFGVT